MSTTERTDPGSVDQSQAILTGQRAIITGASSGIGRGVAKELAEAGADVVVNYRRDESGAAEVVDYARSLGRRAYSQQGDVSREQDVIGLFDRVREEWGSVDILVSNAGIQVDSAIEDMSLDHWNAVIGVNLTGQFLCCREAVREFRKRGVIPEISTAAGKIVCISSVHDLIPWAGHVNYAASKGGVMLMMKSIAQEVAPHRIRINSVSPGAIRTPINREAWETDEAYANLMELVPYNRIGEPSDIGRAVAWLASDASDYVTGATIYVDGGMTLYPGFSSGG